MSELNSESFVRSPVSCCSYPDDSVLVDGQCSEEINDLRSLGDDGELAKSSTDPVSDHSIPRLPLHFLEIIQNLILTHGV